MESHDKQFILNKGLTLGIILMIFPCFDLIFGIDMVGTLSDYLIFVIFWMIIYTYLLFRWTKQYLSSYEEFSFRDTFRVLFLISALAFSGVTVGKTLLWNFAAQDKYIEINEKRDLDRNSLGMSNLDSNDIITQQIILFNKKTEDLIKQTWGQHREEGLPTTHFLQMLISILFINSIYCAILALFLRKKPKFINTN